MKTLLLPVVNGILPRPGGGVAVGGFFDGFHGTIFEPGLTIFVCPLVMPQSQLYRIGVVAKVIRTTPSTLNDPQQSNRQVLIVEMEGIVHARWSTLNYSDGYFWVEGIQVMDFRKNRAEYPVVSGAGWTPQGGYTEFKNCADIPVTLYGIDLEDQRPLSMQANLRGLVSLETAHTIEHAIIRSLRTYGLCTARTLQESMRLETEELTWSVEKSMQLALPELLGQTLSGSCGNPMTHLAHFYMFQELAAQDKQEPITEIAIERARRTVMSRLSGELGLTTEPGIRSLQALKKGMFHDDSPLGIEGCKQVLARFPLHPWT